jgi:hypothetical protein
MHSYLLMTTPFTIAVVRTRKRRIDHSHTALWKRQRQYLQNDYIRWFVIELLLFGLLAAISAWPMIRAIEALRML